MQTYKNINHIVCTDNESDQEYVRKHGRNPILIDRISLIDNDKSVNPNTGKYSPHNLYFNEAQKHVKDGWVMYLDDDDVLMHTNAIEEFVIAIEKANPLTLIFWQMKFLGKPTPGIVNEKNPPRLGTLGTSCFGFHSKHLEHVIWDGWKCGDFRVIEKLYNKLPYNVFIPEVLVYVPEPGSGLKKDINE
jgi:glycosyltransferase involved in cell wall biosynthesis